jgi:16S rRNA (adenine1518-N6/adenine1519-N6)-dimethyltransferase
MDLTNLDDLRTALKLAGIKPKKGLGQHFLVDLESLQAVMAAADLVAADTVLEVGPGLGVMTEPLTKQVKKLVAVEADAGLAELLTRHGITNLEVVNQDIMQYDLTQLPTGYKVVANIPYYITSGILRRLMESTNPPAISSLLMQKEVAERIIAKPGQMSILALSVQYYAEPEITRIVERHKFWPAPHVDSAILRIVQRAQPAFPADTQKLFRLIKAGFGEKRKQLRNSLAGGLNCETSLVEVLLKRSKLAPQARAQELTLADWERLYNEAMKQELL